MIRRSLRLVLPSAAVPLALASLSGVAAAAEDCTTNCPDDPTGGDPVVFVGDGVDLVSVMPGDDVT